jgi:hypothetical protein
MYTVQYLFTSPVLSKEKNVLFGHLQIFTAHAISLLHTEIGSLLAYSTLPNIVMTKVCYLSLFSRVYVTYYLHLWIQT